MMDWNIMRLLLSILRPFWRKSKLLTILLLYYHISVTETKLSSLKLENDDKGLRSIVHHRKELHSKWHKQQPKQAISTDFFQKSISLGLKDQTVFKARRHDDRILINRQEKLLKLHKKRSVPLDSSSTMLADEDGLNASQMPIICLMEWSSPRCKEHAFDVPAPKFAPNFKFPTTPTTRRLTHGLRNANKPEKDVQILERGTTVAPSSGEKNESFFTPIVPKAFKSKNKSTSRTMSTTRWLETTTQASRQKLRTIQTESTTTIPLYAVRPTTPMGDLLTTTKAPIVTTDFPRTALISIASVSVIIIIAFVVFCVFRCRQSAPPSESTYPMAYSGTKQASMGMGNVMLGSGNHGYTPIPSEMSPPAAQHTQQFAGMSPRVNYESMNGAQTLPSAMRRPNGLTNGGPHPNGMGYQTIGQHVVNQNGQTSPARTNGNANGAANGGSRTWGRDRKKDFKEWYV